ncbi:Xanthine/uracil permease [Gracilibacillus ureilyticus]|uniref:Xanthine/uracil permease n=1 Tax=Gracilibacillus ureilyticus TaxID=531814 RepID=A0A1H9R821_9BACI|nr:purine/pyrimidine permease [Gracilibacillus ureilyticus]SER68103.1 Xanthine/uracil permease [Gracilibacillus ureilyticus]
MKNQTLANTTMETIQWFVFLLASSVALPIVIGAIFEMNFTEVSGLMQRTFFIVGVASLLQGLFGHRLPIMEGPAGIWISIFTVMAVTGLQHGTSLDDSLRILETTMIFTGIFLFLFGIFKISQLILPIFTPLVTGVFFFLLTVQLSGTFLQGMLGLQGDSETIQMGGAALAFFTFFIVLGLSIFGKGWLSSYAVLIGIAIGWIMYVVMLGSEHAIGDVVLFSLPELFAFGMPKFDLSVIPIAFITALILISNVVASIVAVSQTLGLEKKDYRKEVNRGTIFSGLNHGLAGVFSSIANVPLATSAGFIGLTGQKKKMPFIYASILLVIIALFPPVVALISSIPSPIANAALMASFVQLVGLAVNNVTLEKLDTRKITIVGVAYLFGMGTMFLPTEVFAEFPSYLQNLLSNGLLVGTAIVIVLEQLWRE